MMTGDTLSENICYMNHISDHTAWNVECESPATAAVDAVQVTIPIGIVAPERSDGRAVRSTAKTANKLSI